MTTRTINLPNEQLGLLEQLAFTLGWTFQNDEPATKVEKLRVFTNEVKKLREIFNTDQISQEEIDRECELVKEELYSER